MNIMPRPRDLIFWAKAAIAQAVNSGHDRVEEADIVEAQLQYSYHAFTSVIVEGSTQLPEIEDVLSCFLGSTAVVTHEYILNSVRAYGIDFDKGKSVIDLLVDLGFLGLEVQRERFEYVYNPEHRQKWRAMTARFQATKKNWPRRYRINDPFHAYLEVTP